MASYKFLRTCDVDGTLHQAGAVVGGSDVPPGSLESLVRMRWVEPVPDRPDPAEVFAAAMGGDPTPAPVPASAPAPEQHPATPGPLVGPPGEVPASAPEQPKVVPPRQPDPKRKK